MTSRLFGAYSQRSRIAISTVCLPAIPTTWRSRRQTRCPTAECGAEKTGAVGTRHGLHPSLGDLQGPAEARLDGRLWGDGAGSVCAVFRHRAIDSATGKRFDAPEVGIYRIRDGRRRAFPDVSRGRGVRRRVPPRCRRRRRIGAVMIRRWERWTGQWLVALCDVSPMAIAIPRLPDLVRRRRSDVWRSNAELVKA